MRGNVKIWMLFVPLEFFYKWFVYCRQIEDHARASSRKCAEILFEEWGTSGRVRPTLVTLRDVCSKAAIYRAADEISSMIQGKKILGYVMNVGVHLVTEIGHWITFMILPRP